MGRPRICVELDVIGADVVEVCPTAIGAADITALVGSRIVHELLTGIALRRAADGFGARGTLGPGIRYKCHESTANAPRERQMPTYVMLTTLTPDGVQTIKNNPGRIREVNREVEQLGATVKAQWATLGQFDFVNVIEAPDEQTITRVSLELGSRGTGRYETLTAIPIDDFIGLI